MSRNRGIQGLRAVAALLVVIQHAVFWSCWLSDTDYAPYLPIDYGRIGVYLFFSISGYVMTLCLKQGSMFMVWRAIRIYPAYWAAILLSAFLVPLIGRPWHADLTSILLLPTTDFNNTYTIPYWTLIFEMVFYVVLYIFILARLSRTGIIVALIVWAALIALVGQIQVVPVSSLYPGVFGVALAYLLSPACLLFIAGALYGLGGQQLFNRVSPLVILLIGSASFLIAQFALPSSVFIQLVFWAIAAVSAVNVASRITTSRHIESAGDDSYGLYLIHVMCIVLALHVALSINQNLSIPVLVAIAVGAGLTGGLAYGALEFRVHNSFLKPAVRRLQERRRLKPRSA